MEILKSRVKTDIRDEGREADTEDGLVQLSPGSGVFVRVEVFASADMAAKKKWEDAFRVLLRALFTNEHLAAHSCLGQNSKLPGLDPVKLAALKCKYYF